MGPARVRHLWPPEEQPLRAQQEPPLRALLLRRLRGASSGRNAGKSRATRRSAFASRKEAQQAMSRTPKRGKPPGYEYWSRGTPGKATAPGNWSKVRKHRKDRRVGKALIVSEETK